nr:hypothetical protein [Tanacetum cinerariifolium]
MLEKISAAKRTAKSTPATTTTTTTTSVTDAHLKALIDQGVANVLAARDAERSQYSEDSHDSGIGVRRQAPPAQAIEMAIELMYKRNNNFAERQAKNKRKFDDTSKNNQHHQQQQNKRQNTGRAYTAGSGDKKPYGGSKPLCSKCNYHHDGQCALKCHKCNKVGHLARDCRSTANANTANNQRGIDAGQKPTCFECGAQGHFKRECPKLKNNN